MTEKPTANRKSRTEKETGIRLKHEDLCNLEIASLKYGVSTQMEVARLGLVALVTRRVPTPDREATKSDINTHKIPLFTNMRARWGRSDVEMMKLCKTMYMTKRDADTVRLGLAALAAGKIK